ncbi:hypothetical protein OEZ86_004325 [Tetradesmus obliquus]|nr:hypothetical protein OEZ86_004325 [Tetradesmus obliquus]
MQRSLEVVSLKHVAASCSGIASCQYTVINKDVAEKSQNSSAVMLKDGSVASVPMLIIGGDLERPDQPTPRFHRGWASNYPTAWLALSYLPSVLQRYQRCLLDKVGGRPSKPMLIWRGTNTGGVKGWAPMPLKSSPLAFHPWYHALSNKRMSLALLARSHRDWMDVGLHRIAISDMGHERETDKQLVQDLHQMLTKAQSPQETWGAYALQLSIDGHGTPDRLPLQYLQGSSVVLKVMSPYTDSFDEIFQAGVHYEPVRYDLNDLVTRGQALIAKFSNDSEGKIQMQRMAAAAGSKALEVFNLIGQLDALAYAVQKVKSSCSWQVQKPPLHFLNTSASGTVVQAATPDGQWEVLKLERRSDGSNWWSPSLKAPWAHNVRQSIVAQLAENFRMT